MADEIMGEIIENPIALYNVIGKLIYFCKKLIV
jgi:hypothetical protein